MCVENKTTNNGPMWVPHGLKLQYRTHIAPFGHYAQILPIWNPFDHACWVETNVHTNVRQMKIKLWDFYTDSMISSTKNNIYLLSGEQNSVEPVVLLWPGKPLLEEGQGHQLPRQWHHEYPLKSVSGLGQQSQICLPGSCSQQVCSG